MARYTISLAAMPEFDLFLSVNICCLVGVNALRSIHDNIG
jgi:hypothetical protein